MRATLIKDLKEQDVLAVLKQRMIANTFVWPRFMPLQFSPTLTWKTLQANSQIPVAADVVAYDSAAPRKTRNVVDKLTGDIPKIEISRVKSETDLNDYNQLLHYAGTDAGRRQLVDYWANDVNFCTDGVNARLEWLMCQALSLGKVSLTKTNNSGGIVTENVVDFLVPTAQKSGCAVEWTVAHAATSVPITNIKAIVKAAKARGVRYNYMLMDIDTFDTFAISAETIKYASTWVVAGVAQGTLPTLDQANNMLRALGLPQIVIMDSYVQLEALAGTKTAVNPFTTGVVTFLPEITCGNVYHAPLADELVESSAAIKAKNQHILIKKFSTEDPVSEITKGMANAFPVWASAQEAYLLYTLATTWTL